MAYFGQFFFVNYRSSSHFLATFSHCCGYALNFTKNGLGYVLGDFFTNSSGHPGRKVSCVVDICGLPFTRTNEILGDGIEGYMWSTCLHSYIFTHISPLPTYIKDGKFL
jgi:hypothetical protein